MWAFDGVYGPIDGVYGPIDDKWRVGLWEEMRAAFGR